MLFGRSADPHYPKASHVALARPPVPVGVSESLLDRLARLAILAAPAPDVAFGELHYLLAAPARLESSLDPWHL